MPRKRRGEEVIQPSINGPSGEVYERGGRVLRVRDTCVCPVCGIYFSPAEIQAHAQACLYFLENESEGKKKPKKLSASQEATPISPVKPVANLSKSDPSSDNKTSPSKSPQPVRVANSDWKPGTVADWNVPLAPVYRPTIAEFKSPLEYINKIRPSAEKFGICVIVPPYPAESWTQNIGDPKSFTFRTKVQNIHQLKTRWQGRNEVFVSNLASFLEKRGEPLRAFPKVEGRDLDLYKLFTSVVNKGGYHVVERGNIWKSVADDLKLSISCVRNNTLRNHYHKYLFAYEMHRKSKLQFRPANEDGTDPNNADDDLYIARDITDDLYNTDYLEEDEGEDEFGFYEGDEYTLAGFEKKAKTFSEKWFPNCPKPTPDQVEEEFWRIVETAEDSVKVDYGSDLDVTKINRSGFPRDQCIPGTELGPYLTQDHTHWNLNHLPRMRGSVLSHIKETVAGVTDPMIYVGMLFSSFCWHTEDNYLYSINYMHKGTAKTWYGIPASAASQFEDVMRATVPDLFIKHPDLLHLLITMVAPSTLIANKVPIYHAVQEPGQYVITFPKAYHAGFSHGFTCAEAVNFAPADWLPFGHESVLHYRTIKRMSVFSHEELVCTIATRDPPPETAFWACKELQVIREREQSSRDSLRLAGYLVQVQVLGANDRKEESKQCKICGYDCYLSYVTCTCSPHYVSCLFHHKELCETCTSKNKILKVLIPLSQLDTLLENARKHLHPKTKSVIDLTLDDDAPRAQPSTPSSPAPPSPAPTAIITPVKPASPSLSKPFKAQSPPPFSPSFSQARGQSPSPAPPKISPSPQQTPAPTQMETDESTSNPSSPVPIPSPSLSPLTITALDKAAAVNSNSNVNGAHANGASSSSSSPAPPSAAPTSPNSTPKPGLVINLAQEKATPNYSEHIALNIPPSISGHKGLSPSFPPKTNGINKPIHTIVIDSPTKA